MLFDLPDVASFPENEAPVRPDDPTPDFASPESFEEDLAELKLGVLDFLGEKQNDILDSQLGRIRQAAWMYFKNPCPAMGGEGITAWTQPTNRLEAFFAEDIKKALCLTPPPDVKSVDRAVSRKDTAALDVVGEFLGHPVKSVTVHVSKPGDKHHRQQFYDCHTITKLLNLHMDPKPGITKAIIYLGNVTREDGPFQFIKGSNQWKVDEIQRIFAWGNSVGNYCHTPQHRRVANAFPPRFRRNAIVGRLIPDGSDLGNFLLDSLTTYTSDVANVMMFDPCFNLHRGGQCKSGTRINLQVVMK
jgi:hypothetical protein